MTHAITIVVPIERRNPVSGAAPFLEYFVRDYVKRASPEMVRHLVGKTIAEAAERAAATSTDGQCTADWYRNMPSIYQSWRILAPEVAIAEVSNWTEYDLQTGEPAM